MENSLLHQLNKIAGYIKHYDNNAMELTQEMDLSQTCYIKCYLINIILLNCLLMLLMVQRKKQVPLLTTDPKTSQFYKKQKNIAVKLIP